MLLVLTKVRKLKVFVRGENKEISFCWRVSMGFYGNMCWNKEKQKKRHKKTSESVDS